MAGQRFLGSVAGWMPMHSAPSTFHFDPNAGAETLASPRLASPIVR